MKKQRFDTTSVKAKMSANVSAASFADSMKNENEPELNEDLDEVREAGMERFQRSMDAWTKIRMNALDDLKFYKGDQWDETLQRVGNARKEPTLTVNRFPQFVKQVENELMKQQISINVYPTDEIGSDDTAQIFAGMIRDIERKSYASSAYIHAAGESGAMVPGFGFLKLETVYSGKKGFEQEIRITSPHDPFKIIPDGDSLESDSSDAQCWFEFEDYSIDSYRRLFPNSELSTADLKVVGSNLSKWVGAQGIRVVKYWYKEELEVIEYLLEDGTIVNNIGWFDPNEEDIEQDKERSPDAEQEVQDYTGEVPDFMKVVNGKLQQKAVLRKRNVVESKVKWIIFNGCEVLEHGEWADSEFPFVSVYGPTLIVDGERDIRGIIRFAKDSQKMLNYMASSAVRRIGSSNKAPWIVDIKSIKGYESQWKTANTENWSMLPWNSTDPDNPNKPLTPPQRADQTGQINDLLQAAVKFENDLKATIGIYDAGLGATPNDQSGVAIKTLAQQGMNSNAHWSDALQRAIQRLGYLLLRLIPKIYDTPRAIRIIGEDATEKIVKINQIFVEGGQEKMFNLQEGEYGVSISAGPNYATKKSQALEQIIKLVGSDPAVLPFIQDILVGEMDFNNAKAIQNRLRKVLAKNAPYVLENEQMDDIPPQAQAAIAQQGQMIEQLAQELQLTHEALAQAQAQIVTKQIDHQHTMEEIRAKLEADLMLEKAKAEREQQTLNTELQHDALKTKMDHSLKVQEQVVKLAKEGHLTDVIRADLPPLPPLKRNQEPNL